MKQHHHKRAYFEYGMGRYAYSTYLRRLVWEEIVWPLITDQENSNFSLKEYQIKRDEVCKNRNITPKHIAGSFMSLVNKGIILHQDKMYSIPYRLIPYMKKGIDIDYDAVLKEVVIRS